MADKINNLSEVDMSDLATMLSSAKKQGYEEGKAAGAEELIKTYYEVLEECVQNEGIKTACKIMIDRATRRLNNE